MLTESSHEGLRPPRQARSRASLRRIFVATEEILAAGGPEQLTMAAVAARSGVSIGALYRRFENKERLLAAVKDRLLGRLEDDLAASLADASPTLAGVVDAFTRTIAAALSQAPAFPYLVIGDGSELEARGRQAYRRVSALFEQAMEAHLAEVQRADQRTAVLVAARTITAACIQRALAGPDEPDLVPWPVCTDQLSDLGVAYLVTPDRSRRSAVHPTESESRFR